MAVCVVRHRLCLVLRFTDTTTGWPVSAADLTLYGGNTLLHPQEREKGTLVFIGDEMSDFDLTVRSRLFEPMTLPVHFPDSGGAAPELDIQLIPSEANTSPAPCLFIEGCSEGMKTLHAVRCGDSSCLIREFEPRKKILTLFNPHHLELGRTHYALVDPEKQSFETFNIEKRIDDSHFKIDRALNSGFNSYFPVVPIVSGLVRNDGRYVFRVRDDSSSAEWLIRCEIGDTFQFYRSDMRQEDTINLPINTG